LEEEALAVIIGTWLGKKKENTPEHEGKFRLSKRGTFLAAKKKGTIASEETRPFFSDRKGANVGEKEGFQLP